MNENKIGQFIAECRKEKNMTQKELAEQLHITDKAVSKWERGLSCPDISLLTPLSKILDVTTGELLNGERNAAVSNDHSSGVDQAISYAEASADKKRISLQHLFSISFSCLLLVGMVVCIICDLAIAGSLTWSRYVISSILFAWLIFIPVTRHGFHVIGITGLLAAVSVFTIPYLYTLSKIVGGNNLVLSIGIKTALPSIVFLWCVYALFRKLRSRRLLAGALSFLLAVPLDLTINFILSGILSTPFFDGGDVLDLSIMFLCAVMLFMLDRAKNVRSAA